MSDIPSDSPANWLQPGEWQVYCPRVFDRPIDRCGFAAPVNASDGLPEQPCERCGGLLRVGAVKLDGTKVDYLRNRSAQTVT